MVTVRTLTRAAIVVAMAAGTAVWYACADPTANSATGPAASPPPATHLVIPDLRAAIAAQRRHTDALLKMPGVVGTAVTLLPDGRSGVQILLERAGIAGLPQALEGIPVTLRVTGRLMAASDPTTRRRPAPMGFSVGHPAITAGTIGARVRDALGRVYILSNNHVLANSNGATIGDPEYQPGPFDGGTAADQIATLSDFQTITFTSTANNTIDAAIALSGTDVLDNATPADDGYGMPNATIYGDANGDGLFDDRNALLGLNVQKYGRTTHLTHGQITGVNATVTVCYDGACLRSARYVDQLIIEPGGFSGGGDSGSLIVTDDGNLNPVALLFAGSPTVTIANRIDLVLTRFGVTIDGLAPPPPGPLTDVAVIGISGPSAAVQGSTASITVTVKNFGNQDVTSAFDVTLQDTTAHVTVGTQSVAGLVAGASATLTFAWTPTTTGNHTLVGSHTLSDDKAANNQRFTTIPVNPPVTDIAVTAFSGPTTVIVGHGLNIGVTVANVGNQNVSNSFTVTLRDSGGGVTLGTQTVPGLAAGAGTLLVFSWNTTNAALGGHTLLASHSFTDDSAADNQGTETVTVIPKPTDIALTSITAPHAVAQGDTAHVVVTVQNVGEVDVSTTFAVELTDGSAGGATVGTRSVTGLAVGATATVDIPWNTAGAAISGHTLIATQKLADDDATNNSMAIGIGVTAPPPPPSTDVAVTAINAPAAVIQGSTSTIGVTVQNVGGQSVTTNFNVVLTDATTGAIIGTQPVNGLAVSGLATVSFSWNTTGAALGGHTLVATQSLADANAANNTRSVAVSVNPQPVDLALTGITAPSRVSQGDIVPVVVTVQNVSGPDVNTTFDVVLTDGSAGGAAIGTQTISGLAAGASATRTFNWNTAGAALNGHTLFATQKLADVNSSNNSAAIGIIVSAPPTTDVAVSNVTAPAAVTQGSTAAVAVSIQNVGGLTVSTSFDIVVTDATAGVTIGTQTVAGLAASSAITRTFNWSTTSAALGGHTLVATLSLSDANTANNQGSATITVNAPTTDLAVTAVSAPAAVLKGNTPTIGVTVQNVGGLTVSSTFNVVLTDATAGVTIGTQAVAGLAVGATATRSFSWSTTAAALGGHTLVATQSLTDDNAANNQRSAVVTVNPQPADIALANITAPSRVTLGDTAAVVVTVQNVGGQDATTNFDIVLTDGTAGGMILGTQTIPGLAMGASATRTFNWNTAGVATGGHTLIATQKLADNNPSNNARAVVVSVDPPSVHVGNLQGRADTTTVGTWTAIVVITAHDAKHSPLNGVTVHGNWNGSSADSTCVTSDAGGGGTGTCTVVLSSNPNTTRFASFAVTALTLSGYVYKSSANHDPDGSSNGFSIIVKRQ
jgi:hypothetical protein